MALPLKSKPAQRPYEHQDYPSIRYRLADDGSIEHRQVANGDDDALLGPGWVDTPTKCTPKPVAPPKPPAPPAKPPTGVKPNESVPKPPAPPAQTGTTEPA